MFRLHQVRNYNVTIDKWYNGVVRTENGPHRSKYRTNDSTSSHGIPRAIRDEKKSNISKSLQRINGAQAYAKPEDGLKQIMPIIREKSKSKMEECAERTHKVTSRDVLTPRITKSFLRSDQTGGGYKKQADVTKLKRRHEKYVQTETPNKAEDTKDQQTQTDCRDYQRMAEISGCFQGWFTTKVENVIMCALCFFYLLRSLHDYESCVYSS